MAAMNSTERQKKTRMLARSHSRVLPEIEMALLCVCRWCDGGGHVQRSYYYLKHLSYYRVLSMLYQYWSSH